MARSKKRKVHGQPQATQLPMKKAGGEWPENQPDLLPVIGYFAEFEGNMRFEDCTRRCLEWILGLGRYKSENALRLALGAPKVMSIDGYLGEGARIDNGMGYRLCIRSGKTGFVVEYEHPVVIENGLTTGLIRRVLIGYEEGQGIPSWSRRQRLLITYACALRRTCGMDDVTLPDLDLAKLPEWIQDALAELGSKAIGLLPSLASGNVAISSALQSCADEIKHYEEKKLLAGPGENCADSQEPRVMASSIIREFVENLVVAAPEGNLPPFTFVKPEFWNSRGGNPETSLGKTLFEKIGSIAPVIAVPEIFWCEFMHHIVAGVKATNIDLDGINQSCVVQFRPDLHAIRASKGPRPCRAIEATHWPDDEVDSTLSLAGDDWTTTAIASEIISGFARIYLQQPFDREVERGGIWYRSRFDQTSQADVEESHRRLFRQHGEIEQLTKERNETVAELQRARKVIDAQKAEIQKLERQHSVQLMDSGKVAADLRAKISHIEKDLLVAEQRAAAGEAARRSELSAKERVALEHGDVSALIEAIDLEKSERVRLEQELRISREECRAYRANVLNLESRLDGMESREIPFSDYSHIAGTILAVVDGTPSIEQSLHFFQGLFPDRVTVLASAMKSAEKSSAFHYPARAFGLLRRLVLDYYDALVAGGGNARAREIFGKDGYASGESESVEGNKAAQRLRTFSYKGKPLLMNAHLKIGYKPGPAETLRVHFHWDVAEKRIIIGYVGPHLEQG